MSYWEIFNEMGIGSTPTNVSSNLAHRNYSYNDFRLDSLYLESVVLNNINKNANIMNESCIQSLTESVDVDLILTEANSDMNDTEKNAISSLLDKFGVAIDNMFNSIYKLVTTNRMWIKINKKKILNTTIYSEKSKKVIDMDGDKIGSVVINDRYKDLYSNILSGDISQFIMPTDQDTKTDITSKYMKLILGEKKSTDLTSFNGKQSKLISLIDDINSQILKDKATVKKMVVDKKYSKSTMPGAEFKEYKKQTNRAILSYRCKNKILVAYISEIMSVLKIFAHESKLKIK